jgi:hypothetical protein
MLNFSREEKKKNAFIRINDCFYRVNQMEKIPVKARSLESEDSQASGM